MCQIKLLAVRDGHREKWIWEWLGFWGSRLLEFSAQPRIPGPGCVRYLLEKADATKIHFYREGETRVQKGLVDIGGSKALRYLETLMAAVFADSSEADTV